MAQSGYTPVSLYYSTTAAATPTAGNLQLGELSINITDGKLYYRTVGGVVTLLASATTAAGIANNIAGGTAGAIVYQSGVGTTTFLPIGGAGAILASNGSTPSYISLGTSGYILTSNGSAPTYVNPTSITVGNASLAATATNVAGGTANKIVYQTGVGTTGFITAPTTGYVLSWTGSAYNWIVGVPSGSAASLSGGSAGAVVYQSAIGVSAFVTPGTSSQVLLSGGTGSPTWADQSTLTVGNATTATTATNATNATNAVTATNIAGGSAGVVPYQTGSGATGFSAVGTSGQVLLSGGTGSPTWVNQSSISAGSTTLATNLAGGIASQIPYQSAPGTTSFITNGVVGQALISNGTAAPSFKDIVSGAQPFVTMFTGSNVSPTQNSDGFGLI